MIIFNNAFMEEKIDEYRKCDRDKKKKVNRYPWKSGEIFTYYHDWEIARMDEVIFDCNSGGMPHKHCIDIMIAKRYDIKL